MQFKAEKKVFKGWTVPGPTKYFRKHPYFLTALHLNKKKKWSAQTAADTPWLSSTHCVTTNSARKATQPRLLHTTRRAAASSSHPAASGRVAATCWEGGSGCAAARGCPPPPAAPAILAGSWSRQKRRGRGHRRGRCCWGAAASAARPSARQLGETGQDRSALRLHLPESGCRSRRGRGRVRHWGSDRQERGSGAAAAPGGTA